jgi:hypothetical protein
MGLGLVQVDLAHGSDGGVDLVEPSQWVRFPTDDNQSSRQQGRPIAFSNRGGSQPDGDAGAGSSRRRQRR